MFICYALHLRYFEAFAFGAEDPATNQSIITDGRNAQR